MPVFQSTLTGSTRPSESMPWTQLSAVAAVTKESKTSTRLTLVLIQSVVLMVADLLVLIRFSSQMWTLSPVPTENSTPHQTRSDVLVALPTKTCSRPSAVPSHKTLPSQTWNKCQSSAQPQ